MSNHMRAPSFGIEYRISTLARLRRAVARLQDVAAPAERDAELAVGEVLDVLARS
jgi:hypothetical protein